MRNGNYYDEEIEDATGWSAFVARALIGAGLRAARHVAQPRQSRER